MPPGGAAQDPPGHRAATGWQAALRSRGGLWQPHGLLGRRNPHLARWGRARGRGSRGGASEAHKSRGPGGCGMLRCTESRTERAGIAHACAPDSSEPSEVSPAGSGHTSCGVLARERPRSRRAFWTSWVAVPASAGACGWPGCWATFAGQAGPAPWRLPWARGVSTLLRNKVRGRASPPLPSTCAASFPAPVRCVDLTATARFTCGVISLG